MIHTKAFPKDSAIPISGCKIRELYIYSPPDLGIDPPRIPQTSENPMPQRSAESKVAMIKFPPV
jgi:hypothetical protein